MRHLDKKIGAFIKLGKYLRREKIDPQLNNLILKTQKNNRWFTFEYIIKALRTWGDTLKTENIHRWISKYNFDSQKVKKIGIIMAGNIPMVGFHDLICVLFTNHTAFVKTSSSDPYLIPFIYNKLIEFENDFVERVIFKNTIESVNAVIASGNNVTIKHINEKFNLYPSILRGNRSSIAILNGEESLKELKLLSNDIFAYFGFGCRSITKIYVPKNYNFKPIIRVLKEKSESITLNDYLNNFKRVTAINKIIKSKFYVAGKLVIIQDKSINAEISSINYEYYDNEESLINEINLNLDMIQCVVGNNSQKNFIKFGDSQKPSLWNYADNIDTIKFLLSL